MSTDTVHVRRWCGICHTNGPWTETPEPNWYQEIVAQRADHNARFHPVAQPVQFDSRRGTRPARKAA